jgi:hypothetical protein
MDSPITNTLANVAGRGVGVLAALDSIKSGGLGSYLIQREKAIADPDIRANLIGSPFAAGMLQVSGDTARPPVATPADFVGPPTPAAAVAGPSDIAYLAPSAPDRRWTPNPPPLSTAEQVKQATEQGTLSGLTGPDMLARVQAKLASKIPLTNEEFNAALSGAKGIQRGAGPGSTVGLQVPGMAVQIGSPYNFASIGPDEYSTPETVAAAASQRPGYRPIPSGRGTWLLAPPPTQQQLLPVTPPAPVMRGQLGGPGAAPPAPPAPGHVNLQAPFLRQLEVDRGLPVGVLSGLAEHESGGNPNAANPDSSARGLFQITQGTAQDWGISPDDRYDPVKSAVATADTLAQRAQQVGIERAVGMHYGGPGADFGTPTGPSGLSPAQFASDVLTRARKYAGAVTAPLASVGMAYAAEPPPAAPAVPATPPSVSGGDWAQNLQQRVQAGYITQQQADAALAGAPPSAVAPAPAVVARPPRPSAAPAAALTFDPSATVPHVLVPAPAPAEARVGYPPAAPTPPPGTMVPTAIPVLRPPTGPPAGAPAVPAVATIAGAPPPAAVLPGIPVEPSTGLPLTGRTIESQTGSETFTAPPRGDVRTQMVLRYNGVTDPATADPAKIVNTFATEQALKNQDDMSKAAIERTQRGFTEGESKDFQRLTLMQHTLDEFLKTYPEAKDRAQFLGVAWAPWQTMLQRIGWQGTRAITDFRNGFAPFSLESLTDEKGKAQAGMEDIARVAPSQNDSPDQFESNLQHFSDGLADKITIAANLRGMPIGAATPELVNSWRDQLHQDRMNARLAAFQLPTPTAPPAAPPTAPAPAEPAPAPWAPAWIH